MVRTMIEILQRMITISSVSVVVVVVDPGETHGRTSDERNAFIYGGYYICNIINYSRLPGVVKLCPTRPPCTYRNLLNGT